MIRNVRKLGWTRFSLVFRTLHNTPILKNTKAAEGSTKDATEISKFENKSETWWDEQGSRKILHSMNAVRVPFVRDGLKNRGTLNPEFADSSTPLQNLNILDVGCGGGILSEPLSQLGAKVTGIDACKDLITVAQQHASSNPELKNQINYIYGAVEDIVASHKDQFDAVVSSECLEHVASIEVFLKSCVEVLKPGGSLFLTTINKTNLSWLLGIIAAEHVLKILPKGTHDWNKFVPPHEVQKILENSNCQTNIIRGYTYNFITNKWFWTSNTSINYALHAIKKV